jgi:hypothetical protein
VYLEPDNLSSYRNSNSRTQKGDKKMRFPRKSWFFAGVLSTIFVLTMVSSAFCETPGIPPGYSDIEEAIYASQEAVYATSQEGTTPPRCGDCHSGIAEPHHAWIPHPEYPGDLSSPYNAYCPDPPPGPTWSCRPCHSDYVYDEINDQCQTSWAYPANSCVACHALSVEDCHPFVELEFPAQCIEQALPGECAGPQTPEVMVQELVNTVIDLNIQSGISNALDAKLDTALSTLDDMNSNNDVAAINSLNAFINSVEAQRGNKISEEDANTLIAATEAIISKLQAE